MAPRISSALAGWALVAVDAQGTERPTIPPIVRSWLPTALVCGGAVVAAALGEDAYHVYTGEDGICEMLQVAFFAFALVEAIRAWHRLARAGRRIDAALYVVAVAGLVFLIGEEVSWGQRVFGWGTPEELAAINKQGETNLHNLAGAHESVGWFLLLIGFWGSLLRPLLERLIPADTRRLLEPYVAGARLFPYFFPMFVWRLYRNFFPLPGKFTYAIVQVNEVLELVMAIGFWLFFRDRARSFAGSESGVRSAAGS
jgi:hypothetical protein